MTRLCVALFGCVAVLIGSAPQCHGDDTDQTRKALQEVSDTVGEKLIAQRIETLRQNPERARELIRLGAKLAREEAPPLNFTSAYVLAAVARELKDYDAGVTLARFCSKKAAALKSDRKMAVAFLLHLALLVENKEAEAASQLALEYLKESANNEGADELTISDDRMLSQLVNDIARHKDVAGQVVQRAGQHAEAWRQEDKAKRSALNPAAAYLLARLAEQVDAVDHAEQLLRVSVEWTRAVLERRVANIIRERAAQEELVVILARLARLYTELLDLLFDHGKYQETEKLAKEILEFPLDGPMTVAKNQALTRNIQAIALQGRVDEAMKALEPVVKKFPDEPQVLYLNGWLLLQAGRTQEAIASYEALLSKASTEEFKDRVRYVLSGVYSEAGQPEKAIQQLRILVQKYPDNSTYNNDLGYMLADNDQELDEAERLIRKALEAEPKRASYLDSLGWVLFKKGKYKEAKEPLLLAIQDREGQHSEIYDHLGDVHWALGEKDDAIAAWKKALKLIGKSPREQRRKMEIEKKLAERENP